MVRTVGRGPRPVESGKGDDGGPGVVVTEDLLTLSED